MKSSNQVEYCTRWSSQSRAVLPELCCSAPPTVAAWLALFCWSSSCSTACTCYPLLVDRASWPLTIPGSPTHSVEVLRSGRLEYRSGTTGCPASKVAYVCPRYETFCKCCRLWPGRSLDCIPWRNGNTRQRMDPPGWTGLVRGCSESRLRCHRRFWYSQGSRWGILGVGFPSQTRLRETMIQESTVEELGQSKTCCFVVSGIRSDRRFLINVRW